MRTIKLINKMELKKVFLDIETHYVKPFHEQSELIQGAFIDKYYKKDKYDQPNDQFMEIAGLNPEFGQIICISLGYEDPNTAEFKVKAYSGLDEKKILTDVVDILTRFAALKYGLVGFNSNAFDIPFITRRMIKYGMKVPAPINTFGMKPWEVSNEDVMLMWKGQSWNNTGLQTIAAMLDIPSKSEEISGTNMYKVPIEEMDWDELEKYCNEDVEVTYKIYKRIIECLK